MADLHLVKTLAARHGLSRAPGKCILLNRSSNPGSDLEGTLALEAFPYCYQTLSLSSDDYFAGEQGKHNGSHLDCSCMCNRSEHQTSNPQEYVKVTFE